MGRKRFLALVMALSMLFTLMAPALTFATGTGSEEETPGAGTSEVTEEANEQGSDTDPDEGDGAGNDAGDTNTGADNTGDTGTGDVDTGDVDTGDTDTGDTGTGDVDTGDTGTDETGTGDTGTGDVDTGDTGTGDVDTGDAGDESVGGVVDSNEGGSVSNEYNTGSVGAPEGDGDTGSGVTYFTVTLKGNGGVRPVDPEDPEEDETSYEAIFEAGDVQLPANPFSRDGYTFTGWNTQADGLGAAYGDGEALSLAEDMTFFAQWEEDVPAQPQNAGGDEPQGASGGEPIPEEPTRGTTNLSGACGDDLTWAFDVATGTLTISGSGAMTSAPWRDNLDDMLSVQYIVLEDGVTSICSQAFESCKNVETLNIPNSVITIGSMAFSQLGQKANYLTITFGNSLTTIEGGAFAQIGDCKSPVQIVLPNSLTTIGYQAFYDTYVDITFGNGITTIEDFAFDNNRSTKPLTLPASIQRIGMSAFGNWTGLNEVDYLGTKAQQAEINISDVTLLNATWHCTDGDVVPQYAPITVNVQGADKINWTLWTSRDRTSDPMFCTQVTDGNVLVGMYLYVQVAGKTETDQGQIGFSYSCVNMNGNPGSDFGSASYSGSSQKAWFPLWERLGNGPVTVTLVVDPVQLTLEPNGATEYARSQQVPSGYAAPIRANPFTREGYVFAGWNTAADGSGTAYADGADITLTGNSTLYAQWTPVVTVNVQGNADKIVYSLWTSNTNDATGPEACTAYTIGAVPVGQHLYVRVVGKTDSDTGLIFFRAEYVDGEGYPTSMMGGNGGSFSGSSQPAWKHYGPLGDGPVTVTLVVDPVTLTLNPNGATGDVHFQPVPFDTATAITANPFTRDGYVFSGWNTAADGSGTAYAGGAEITLTESLTLYAQWLDLANGNIPVDATIFPDANLLAFARSRDTDQDGFLSTDEIAAVKSISSLSAYNDLTGLTVFTELETISFTNTHFARLDVSSFSKLRLLGGPCGPGLTEIVFGPKNAQNLKELYIDYFQGTSIDISPLTALENTRFVMCNNLTYLDVSHNQNLIGLGLGYSPITSLDLSNNAALEGLSVDGTKLTTLDLSHNPNLKSLYCGYTQLTSLDLSHNPLLETLDCCNSKLTGLNLDSNTKLWTLQYKGDDLTTVSVAPATLRSLILGVDDYFNNQDYPVLIAKEDTVLDGVTIHAGDTVTFSEVKKIYDNSGYRNSKKLTITDAQNNVINAHVVVLGQHDHARCSAFTDAAVHLEGEAWSQVDMSWLLCSITSENDTFTINGMTMGISTEAASAGTVANVTVQEAIQNADEAFEIHPSLTVSTTEGDQVHDISDSAAIEGVGFPITLPLGASYADQEVTVTNYHIENVDGVDQLSIESQQVTTDAAGNAQFTMYRFSIVTVTRNGAPAPSGWVTVAANDFDPDFWAWLVEQKDEDEDHVFHPRYAKVENGERYINLDADWMQIDAQLTNLQGVNKFINLEVLTYEGRDGYRLTAIDLSDMTKLRELNLNDNRLTSLDLSDLNPDVFTDLYIDGNSIPALILPSGTRLQDLGGDDNPLGQRIECQTLTEGVDGTWSFDVTDLSSVGAQVDPSLVTVTTAGPSYNNTTGIVTFTAKPDSFTYEYSIGDCGDHAYTMPVTVVFSTTVELDFENQDRYHEFRYGFDGYIGWQVLDYWTNEYLSVSVQDAEQLLADGKWFSLFFYAPPAVDEIFYADALGQVSLLEIYGGGTYAFDFQQKTPIYGIDIFVNHPGAIVTISGTTSHPGEDTYINAVIFNGNVTINGDLDSLTLAGKANVPNEDAVVHVNGSIEELIWYDESAKAFSNGNRDPYMGDLYVTGAIVSGLVKGQRAIDISTYIQDYTVDYDIGTFTKTGAEPDLVIEDGVLKLTLTENPLDVSTMKIVYRLEEDAQTWTLLAAPANAGYLRVMGALEDFDISKIVPGDNVGIVLKGAPAETVELSGRYFGIDIYAGTVHVTGEAGYTLPGLCVMAPVGRSASVIIDCAVDELQIESTNRQTQIQIGPDGSVDHGYWSFYVKGWEGDVSTRLFGAIGPNQQVMTNGAFLPMSVNEYGGGYGAILTDMAALEDAVNCSGAHISIMDIRNDYPTLSSYEQSRVWDVAPGADIVSQFDVVALTYDLDESGTPQLETREYQLSGDVVFYLQTPVDDAGAIYKVVRLYNGEATLLDGEAHGGDGMIRVQTGTLGRFVVVNAATMGLDFEHPEERYHGFWYGRNGYNGWQVLDEQTDTYWPVSPEDAERLLTSNNWFYLTFEAVPTEEDIFYSDYMGQLGSVYFNCPGEMSFDASAASERLNCVAVGHPDARITFTRASGAQTYFYTEVYSGSLTFNGDTYSLLLSGTETTRDDAVVRINGSVTELTWYGATSQMGGNGNGAPFTGDLYVTGTIQNGIESGKRVIHIDEYVGDIEANLAVRRFSKKADDGELIIEDGELVSSLLQAAETVGEITCEDLYLAYSREIGDWENWKLDVSVDPDLGLGTYASTIYLENFDASKIQSGDSVVVYINDSPSNGDPIILSGQYAEVDVSAGSVKLTGSTSALYVWGFGMFSHAAHPQTEVIIDGQVDFLSIQGVHRGTNVRTGENGSVNSGMWSFYFNGCYEGAPSRWWYDPIGADQQIMAQGSLKIMSVDGNGEYGAIVAGMDDLTAAAGITDNNSFAAMEIRNAEVSLDEAEQELVSNAVPGGTILTEFDVQVTAYTVDEDGNMTDMNSVSALETAAAFALQTPTNDPDATYQVVRLHEEDGETVATPVGDPAAATAGRVEVTSSLFSKYVVVKVGGSPFTGSWTPVDPNEFDPAFLVWLMNHDYVREVDGEYGFDLDADRMEIDADLSSIRGVNKFINLEVLAYEGHENWENGQAYRLTGVDLSGMTKLQELYLNDNALTSGALVASNWSTDTIRKLELRGNGLESIAFLNSFTALKELNVSNNNLTAIDVSGIHTLRYLDCQFNGDLAALTVNPELEGLCMGGTKLSLNDIEFNGAALKILKIDYMSEDQNITATDLINQQNLDGLETLDLDNHDWGTFDFSHWQSTLKDIRIDGCGLTGLTLGTNLPNMTRVRANGNRLTSLDLIGMNPQVFTELYLFENSIPALTLPAGTKLEGECGDGLMDEGRHPLQQIIHDATVTDNGDGTWRFDLHALSNDLNPAKVSIDVQGLVTEYDSTTGIVTFSAEPKNFTYEYDIGDCGRFAYKMPVLVCFYTAGEGVAQVGDTVYDTFAAAAAAANNGEQVITLLANIVEPYTLGVDVHTVKVDRDEYSISIPMDAPCWGSVQLTYEENVEVYHLEYAVADPDEDWAGRYRHLYYYEGGWFIDDHENGDRLTLVTADFLRDHITSNINAHLMAAPAANDPMWDVILSNLGDSATGTMMMLDGLDFSCSGKVTLVIPEGVNCGMAFAVNNPEADITIIRYDTSNPAIDVNAGKLTYTGDIGELRLWTREGQGDVNSSVTVNGNIQEIDFRGNGANEESIKAFLGRVYVNGTIGKIRERGIQILDLREYNMGIHEVNMAVRLVEQYVTHGTELIIENVDEDDIGIVIPTQTVTIQNENLTFDFHLAAGSDHDIAQASCSAFDSVTGSYCSFDLENFTMSDLGNIPVEQMNAVVIGRGEGYTLDLIGTYHNVQVQNNANLNVPEGTVLSWLLIDNAEPDKRHDEDQVPNQMITIGGQVGYGLELRGHMNHTTVVIESTGNVAKGTWGTFNYGDYYNMKTRYFRASEGVIMENGALKVLSYDVQNFDSALGAIMPSSATLDAATEVAENQSVYMDISSSNVENLTDDERTALGLTDGEDGAIAAVFSVDVAKLTFKDGRVESGEVVTQLNNEVPFVLELPEDADSNIYEVIRLHEEGGGIEATTVTTSAIGEDTVTVSSNKFSVYLLRRIVPVASFVVDEGTGIASATIDNSAFQTGENVEKGLIAPAENSVITVTFDETAVAAIADRVEALDDTVGIILSVEKIAEESAGTGDVASVTFKITMVTTTGEEVFSDSNAEGTAIVTVPFPAGDGKVPLVYLVTGDVQTPIQVIGHTAETVTFVARHFSVYKVVSVDDTPVTVTFDLNGGRIGDSTENITVNVTPGQMIGDQKPADPTKTAGTFFAGWCTSNDGGTTLNATAFDFTALITESVTLYARWIEEPNVGIGATLDLSEYIRIRARIRNLAQTDHLEYYHVEATFNGKTTVSGLISELLDSGEMIVSGSGSKMRYICVVADVAAKEMADEVHVVLSYVEDPTFPVILYTFDYSVRQYCEEVIEDSQAPGGLQTLCQATLNYGASAQRFFNYHTDDLANNNYNVGESNIPNTVINQVEYTYKGECTGILTTVGSTLNLESATELRIRFKPVNNDTSTLNNYIFSVNGTTTKAVVDGSRFVVKVSGITAPQLGKMQTVVIRNKTDNTVMTIQYSPMVYAYDICSDLQAPENLVLTMKALYCYNIAATTYFQTN